MLIYVSFDGDTIGQKVGRARLSDDVEMVRRISQAIDQGNLIWKSWAESVGGSIIELGGDEGALEVPADRIGELPAIREQYAGKVGASVSVGVGLKLGESSKALLVAKLQGKDRIVFYTEECDKIIAEAQKRQPDEAGKIADEYLNKAQILGADERMEHYRSHQHEAPPDVKLQSLGERGGYQVYLVDGDKIRHTVDQDFTMGGNPGRYRYIPEGEVWIENNVAPDELEETIAHELTECREMETRNKNYDNAHDDANVAQAKVAQAKVAKAAPAMNPGAFAGASRPSQPTVQKPVATQGEHSQAHDLYDLLDDENAPAPAEATHAAKDFERQLHDEAWKGEEEDMHDTAQHNSQSEQVKEQVVQALQALKAQAPVLEQVKSVAPGAYKAMMLLAQSVIGLAKQLSPAQPMQKSEGSKDKTAKLVDQVRNAHKDESRGKIDLEHCQKGDCYEQVDALYHLLGGEESGYQPHFLYHGNFGPHWFLKNAQNRILDPMADTHHEPLPYDKGLPANFLTDGPSQGAMEVIHKILGFDQPEQQQKAEMKAEAEPHDKPPEGDELEKAKLPMPHAPTRNNVTLPVGSQVDQKLKVQHQDGSTSWKQVGSGEIRSMDPAGHATSSRTPNSR